MTAPSTGKFGLIPTITVSAIVCVLVVLTWVAVRSLEGDPDPAGGDGHPVRLVAGTGNRNLELDSSAHGAGAAPAQLLAPDTSSGQVSGAEEKPLVPHDSMTASEAWDRLYSVSDSLIRGTMTQEKLVDLALGLLDQWDPSRPPRIEQGGAVLAFDLLGNAQSADKVTAYINLNPGAREQQDAFRLTSQFQVNPGVYVQDGSGQRTRSSLEVGLSLDEEGMPSHFSGLTQNLAHHTAGLRSFLRDVGQPVPTGGSMDVQADGARWYQITMEAPGNPGRPQFTSTISDPVVVEAGGLADPRLWDLKARFLTMKQTSAH